MQKSERKLENFSLTKVSMEVMLMKKLIVAMALATVCLFGVPQNTMVSHAEMTWQVESAREETQGDMTYLFYPNADGHLHN